MENNHKYIMVRFGELSTKGKNKKNFIKILASNIKNSLKEFNLEYFIGYDHIYIDINSEEKTEEIYDILQDVSGIRSFSIVYKLSDDLQEIVRFCSDFIIKANPKTFKLDVKRSDKSYPYRSMEVISAIAGKVLNESNAKVDVHKPDILFNIEIRQDGVFAFCKTIIGAGGYPLGSGGKALMMLSGGIDSPVASYLLMKRGIYLEFIHFASPPYTQEGVIQKLKDICSVLNRYQMKIKLHIIPFTRIQEAIYKNSSESYAITIMRRRMYEIACLYASKHNLLAICNGESIGQVASQTLNSMDVIDPLSTLPVIRPLAIFDKLNIIEIAKKIGTYDISIRPFEDCCTIFKPKNPKTMPSLFEVLKFESNVDYKTLVEEACDNTQTIIIEPKELEI